MKTAFRLTSIFLLGLVGSCTQQPPHHKALGKEMKHQWNRLPPQLAKALR